MKTTIRLLAFFAFLSFFGCATTRVLNTPSGKPEVIIENKTKKEVADALVSEMVSRGFTIKSVSDYTLVFSKPLDNIAASLLFGSQYDATPEHRPSFMIFESGAGVRVVLTNQIVTNPGSAYERVTDASGGQAGESWQDFLTLFPNVFRGRVGIFVDNKSIVTNVLQSSPAMTAGMLKDDKIVSVNGVPFSKISQLVGDPDTDVIIIVLRQEKELNFTITRKILK
ncbi:MAG: hypothetical protein A3I11_07950 [Elusimicrobia bacterium RIFCSPLOWO2_02_FULL_39_32]|nr:MAG: hypothetical protein A3B80_04955 [Elusimicrobia bacterium RIFCSPHIGHO2_02_FULL_39_36]OGR93515.1 MAG: hypothetical protein A3I11_07950 [Elusimicrobia bacterium RIFCSPLOWO2_02_FULL_39_32]OGS00859.1 MAG: hypothetical protein A3G85_08840 [Elusimicrobia bacterium RIFCSPLOWO2_12_FULL_39_28]